MLAQHGYMYSSSKHHPAVITLRRSRDHFSSAASIRAVRQAACQATVLCRRLLVRAMALNLR
jgi:hypothetical protein